MSSQKQGVKYKHIYRKGVDDLCSSMQRLIDEHDALDKKYRQLSYTRSILSAGEKKDWNRLEDRWLTQKRLLVKSVSLKHETMYGRALINAKMLENTPDYYEYIAEVERIHNRYREVFNNLQRLTLYHL